LKNEMQCRKDTSYFGGTQGRLPPCGDLATPYVPAQEPVPERYSHADALNQGTLFPALNLPFHLSITGRNVVNTPLNELQALEFVVKELALYLDTHSDDEEALYVFKHYVALEETARKALMDTHGPFFLSEAAMGDTYSWVQDPWPWNLTE